jgi:hypothetical protein
MGTNSASARQAVLSVCLNDSIRHTRHLLLELAGYNVESVLNCRDVRSACRRRDFALLITCHSLQPAVKKFLAAYSNLLCPRTPVLELCLVSPEMKTGHYLINAGPETLLQTVASIIGPGKARRQTQA